MFLIHQASDFNNWEKCLKKFYIFSYSMGGFLSNEISSQDEILLVSSSNETHVQIEIFLSRGWDFISVTCKRTLNFFLVSFKYREIITIKTWILYKKLFFFIKSLENKKKKLALTLIHYASQEIWLGNSKKLISIDQSRFYIFSHPRELKNV